MFIMYTSIMSNESKTKTTMYLVDKTLRKSKQIMLDKDGKINLSALVENLLSEFCEKYSK